MIFSHRQSALVRSHLLLALAFSVASVPAQRAVVIQEGSAQVTAEQAPAPVQSTSSLLQPALDRVAHTGSSVDLNRWKGSNALREVDANLASMQKDMQVTLPPLLAVADAAPGSASASLPVLLNLDALYSVLLRVAIASRGSAPRDENTALEQAATLLDSARRDLGDSILAAARAQEKRTADLQAQLQQQPSPVAAPPPATVPKPKKRHTAAAVPAAH